MIKHIVTGGAGFIGSHLVEALVKKKKNVVVLDNLSTGRFENIKKLKNNIKFIKADISKKGNWEKEFKGKVYLYHLAALADIVPSIQEPEKYFQSNVYGTFNIIEACKKSKVIKFIYSASSSCYGIPKKYPTKENANLDPKYPYALTKKIAEDLILHWSKIYKIPTISLRLFNVYGTRSRTSGTYGAMFGVFLAQKYHNKPLTIVGNGTQKRDFIHVEDLSEAIIKCFELKKNYILNLGGGNPVSVIKIAKMISKKLVFIPKRPGEPDITFANISLTKKVLKWKPKISIEEGVKRLLIDICDWKKAPVWTPKKIKTKTRLWFKYLS